MPSAPGFNASLTWLCGIDARGSNLIDALNLRELTLLIMTSTLNIRSIQLLCASDYMMANLPNTEKKYYYRMDTVNYEVYRHVNPAQLPGSGNNTECYNRTCHGIDLLYSHRSQEYDEYLDNQTVELSEVVQSYWTNFAKYHDPNEDNLVKWPEYNHCWNLDNLLVFEDQARKSRVSGSATCQFWDRVGYVPPYADPSMNTTMTPFTPAERTTSAECVGNYSDSKDSSDSSETQDEDDDDQLFNG